MLVPAAAVRAREQHEVPERGRAVARRTARTRTRVLEMSPRAAKLDTLDSISSSGTRDRWAGGVPAGKGPSGLPQYARAAAAALRGLDQAAGASQPEHHGRKVSAS